MGKFLSNAGFGFILRPYSQAMIFPIGDDQVQGGYPPVFSYSFIVVNIAIFSWMLFSLDTEGIAGFYKVYGSVPVEAMEKERLWTLLTAMFLHGGIIHLVGNMIFLWVFADNIEATIGNTRFVLFYLMGGVLASVAHIWFNPLSEVPAIGASGAISAVLGAYMILFPASRIRVFIVILLSRATLPAFLFLGIWIAQQLVAGIGTLGHVELDSGGVAWWAHIGGFAYGVVAGFYFRMTRPKPRIGRP
jgi:membrane associated rhomboid family serine protease